MSAMSAMDLTDLAGAICTNSAADVRCASGWCRSPGQRLPREDLTGAVAQAGSAGGRGGETNMSGRTARMADARAGTSETAIAQICSAFTRK